MEAGGGLVQYVERVAGGSTAEFLCELHALGFAAGEGRCLLPDLDIAKADLRQHRHFVADGGNGLEEFHRVFHRHVQRSEEHTSELQSLMRISYAVFCLKKKRRKTYQTHAHTSLSTN